MNNIDIKEADELYIKHKAEIDALGISQEFIERYGEDVLAMAALIGRMGIEDVDVLVSVFSRLVAAAGSKMGKQAAEALALSLMQPTNWKAC